MRCSHTSKTNVNILEARVVLRGNRYSAVNSIHGGVAHDKLGLVVSVCVKADIDGGLSKHRHVACLVANLVAQSLHSVLMDDCGRD